jgi:DNA-binding response OmpR family regulator
MNQKQKILIVEDELISAEYLKELLLKEGYQVVGRVNSGEKAIQVAREKNPDLILMDIMLEGKMSGCEAAIQIHQDNKDIKFICLTAYAEDEMVEYAIEADVTAYLLKPYRESEILATIKLICSHEEVPLFEPDSRDIPLSSGYTFNVEKGRLFRENKEVTLGKKSLKLIEILAKNRGISLSNEQICNFIWGEVKNDRTLRSLIYRVRETLAANLIQNINGLGYKIV